LKRMGRGLDVRFRSRCKGMMDVQVEVDANLIAGDFDGPAFGSAALREVIDRDAMVI